MTTRHTEHEFTSLARNRFEKSVRKLDGDTLADLAAIRARALARRPLSSRRWLLVPAGAGYRFAHEELGDWALRQNVDVHTYQSRYFDAPAKKKR